MEDECTTPRQLESRIPPPILCPPAPRKKSTAAAKKREHPTNAYFRPPELDAFFAVDAPTKAYLGQDSMDTKGRLIAGSHNRNEFVLINADEVGRASPKF
ncbi:hypothetical protein L1987_71611 [Smallanthus sonchifolius]|uniref:Uncharacterized protein n=1 Tax=Smallanthus sonchifolius TaxID=185202 RepID=A0ACB9ATK9_9ASTR|nr:hypothetical protein L1987_71611 [Smallanthus sonchifolius]